MKKCKRCGVVKDDADFHLTLLRGVQMRRGVCVVCRKAQRIEKSKAGKLPDPDPTPPMPTAERVVQQHQEAAARRDLAAEHRVLAEKVIEQERLIAELGRLNVSPTVIAYSKPAWERSDAVANAIASDWHVEEEVQKEHVHGVNEYNLAVATARSRLFFQHLLKLADKEARECLVRTIHMSWAGDFFSGHIHEELLHSTLLAPGDAANFVVGLLCSGVDFLLKESSYTLDIDALPGNHGRMTKQIWFANPTGTSLETFLYRAVAARYENNPRVRIRVSDQAMVYRRVFERFNVRTIHGYEVKYGGGVGGITIPLNKAIAQWDQLIRADLTELGHFHQFLDGGRFIVNGSLIGYNNYAQAIKASFEEPRQAFYLIDARNGGTKSGVFPIWVDEAHKEARVDAA